MSAPHPYRALYARAASLANLALILVVTGLVAWLSTRYEFKADWTATSRHTLSEISTALLAVMPEPIRVTAYVSSGDPGLKSSISELIARYQRIKPDVELKFVDTDAFPEQARRLNITVDGELVVEYQGRSEQVTVQTEAEVSNALQRLRRGGERYLAFLTGHGERDPRGQANHDLQAFADQLAGRGVSVQPLSLAGTGQVPDNTASLIIAGPSVALTEPEVKAIGAYVEAGGNLFWIIDDGQLQGLQPLADLLGVQLVPGQVVDPNAEQLRIPDPRFAVILGYPPSAALGEFNLVTVLPTATALTVAAPPGWQSEELLKTTPESWAETSPLEGGASFDAASDQPGPLTVGIAFRRPRPVAVQPPEVASAASTPAPPAATPAEPQAEQPGEQRIVIVGDGDFLSNAYLGSSGNLELGVKLINWLTGDEVLINVPARTARDTQLDLSPQTTAIIGLTALLGVPLLLLVAGFTLWWRRRSAA